MTYAAAKVFRNSPMAPPNRPISVKHASLRHRLLLSTLSGTPLHITRIRSSSLTPGLSPAEISLLRLLDSITNGTFIEISVTGTALLYRPGLITGNNGKPHVHTLPESCDRGISYYLEVLSLLAPFSKAPFDITLVGGVITSATADDYSIDTFRAAVLPLFHGFDISKNIEIRVHKRSSGPLGNGEAQFLHRHQVRMPKTLHLQMPGRVKRIRGVAYCTGTSADNNKRTIAAARGVLNSFIPDIQIYSDVTNPQLVPDDYGKDGALERAARTSGPRAGGKVKKVGVGFGLSLIAETGTGSLYAADAFASPGEPAEDVGRRAAFCLLEEIEIGGCVGRIGVLPVLTMMMMGTEGDVGRVTMGTRVVDEAFVARLRGLKNMFGGQVALRKTGECGDEMTVSVVGRGIGNIGKKLA